MKTRNRTSIPLPDGTAPAARPGRTRRRIHAGRRTQGKAQAASDSVRLALDTNPLKPGFWMTDEARGHSERFRAMTRDTLTMLIEHAEQLRDHGVLEALHGHLSSPSDTSRYQPVSTRRRGGAADRSTT